MQRADAVVRKVHDHGHDQGHAEHMAVNAPDLVQPLEERAGVTTHRPHFIRHFGDASHCVVGLARSDVAKPTNEFSSACTRKRGRGKDPACSSTPATTSAGGTASTTASTSPATSGVVLLTASVGCVLASPASAAVLLGSVVGVEVLNGGGIVHVASTSLDLGQAREWPSVDRVIDRHALSGAAMNRGRHIDVLSGTG